MAKENKTETVVTTGENEGTTEPINLADVAKQVEEMLAKAREEAAKIVADAKATVGGELTEEQKKAEEERKAYWNEYVEISLFKDNNKYRDDVPIGVNGDIILVQRGKKIKVKRKHAKLLELSNIQDFETSELIDKKSSEFAKTEL